MAQKSKSAVITLRNDLRKFFDRSTAITKSIKKVLRQVEREARESFPGGKSFPELKKDQIKIGWSPATVRKMKRLLLSGVSVREVAHILKKQVVTIRQRLFIDGIKMRELTKALKEGSSPKLPIAARQKKVRRKAVRKVADLPAESKAGLSKPEHPVAATENVHVERPLAAPSEGQKAAEEQPQPPVSTLTESEKI